VNGDLVPNADLRGGRFRHATSDEDRGRVIAAGIPGTVMPPHKFDNTELTGIVAYVRAYSVPLIDAQEHLAARQRRL
jgi:hypothetical protein